MQTITDISEDKRRRVERALHAALACGSRYAVLLNGQRSRYHQTLKGAAEAAIEYNDQDHEVWLIDRDERILRVPSHVLKDALAGRATDAVQYLVHTDVQGDH